MSSQDAAADGDGGNPLQGRDPKRLQAALIACDSAIALNPADAKAHKDRGNALLALERYDAAIESFDRAIALKPDFADAHYNRANVLMRLQQYDAAIQSFDHAIALNPDDAEAYNNRGIAQQALSRQLAAIQSFDRATELRPDYADAYYNRGVALNEIKQHEAASECFRQVIALRPEHADAYNARGIALSLLGQYDAAIQSYDRAVALNPCYAEALANRGNALLALRRYGEALASYDKAVALEPGYAEALSNRGNVLRVQGRLAEALASFEMALAIKADYADALSNRGNTLCDLGRLDEALASYAKALALRPDFAEALCNRGYALRAQGRLNEALASLDKALAIEPDYAEALASRGNVLHELGRYEEALISYDRALAIKPDYAEVLANRGNILRDQGKRNEALACYEKALALKSDFAEVRWSMTMSQLPDVYGAGVEPSERRAAFETSLANLEAWFSAGHLKEGFKAVSSQKVFYLAYQEENNRALLSRYGALCSRLMDDWMQRQQFIPSGAPSADESAITRLGIVSRFFYDHSVWQAILRGWLQHLDRSRFQLHLFYLGTIQDDETAFARCNATTFSQPAGGVKQWVETILGQRLDALIYPEIGMDPMALKLASMRLAPVQISTWGHPETTGLPSMDYYLSAEDFEPDNASANYTERLIALPHLGCCYHLTPVTPTAPDLGALAIDPTLPLLICPGAPFKYAPEHDWVLAAIARKLGRCQFVFFTNSIKFLSDTLHSRLRVTFSQAGLKYDDFVVSIPWQQKPAFYGLLQRADVYLDTIGFSGFNTAMQAVECGLPMVTREGKFMRGRLASGILKRMGMAELVAPTEEAYIDLVVRLASDADYRQRMSARMQESRRILLDDVSPIRALEEFLSGVTRDGSRSVLGSPGVFGHGAGRAPDTSSV